MNQRTKELGNMHDELCMMEQKTRKLCMMHCALIIKKNHYLSLLMFIALMLIPSSCKNDIDLNIQNESPRLCLLGYIHADSTSNELLVALTDAVNPQRISNADVRVSVNGEFRQQGDPIDYAEGWYQVGGPFKVGDVVRIDVEAHGQHAYVEETVPRPLALAPSVTLRRDDRTEHVRIAIDDDATRDDYYRLVLEEFIVDRFEQYRMWEHTWEVSYFNHHEKADYDCTSDPILMDGHTLVDDMDFDMPSIGAVENRYGIFSDHMFVGERGTLNVSMTWPYWMFDGEQYDPDYYRRTYSSDLRVTVESITSAEFYYLKAMNTKESDIYDDNSDLTGPMRMPSNVHGGTGMVGFRTSRSITLPCIGDERYPGIY